MNFTMRMKVGLAVKSFGTIRAFMGIQILIGILWMFFLWRMLNALMLDNGFFKFKPLLTYVTAKIFPFSVGVFHMSLAPKMCGERLIT